MQYKNRRKSSKALAITGRPPELFNTGQVGPRRKKTQALARVAQWIESWPENQRVAGSIPSQGTCLGYGPSTQFGVCRRQLIDVSLKYSVFHLPLFLPLSPLSKNKLKKKKDTRANLLLPLLNNSSNFEEPLHSNVNR